MLAIYGVSLALPAKAHPGWGIVVDTRGQVYFADVVSNTIWKIGPDGKLRLIAHGKHSHTLNLDADGSLRGEHVYYAPGENKFIGSLWKITSDGRLLDLPRGSTLLVDSAASGYLASDNKIFRRPPGGNPVLLAGGATGQADGRGAAAGFRAIQAMVLTEGNVLYVSDFESVRRVMPDGRVSTLGGNPLGGMKRGEHPRVLGVSVDSKQNILVADYDKHRVWKIGENGTVMAVYRSGFFWSPSGVFAGRDGLYILEHHPESPVLVAELFLSEARVRRLAPDGTITTLATVWKPRALALTVTCLVFALSGVALGWRRLRRG